MKKIIERAINLDIYNICTRNGYNGADILTISSYNIDHIHIIESFLNIQAMNVKKDITEANIYNELEKTLYTLHCVFSEDRIDNEIFDLK